MSNTAVPQSPKQKRYGFAVQGGFTTAAADASACYEVACEDTEIISDVLQVEIAGSHGSRIPKEGNFEYHSRGSMPTLNISGPAKQDELDHFLYAAVQGVSEGGTTPYAKTFTWPSTQPDFQSNAGYWLTWFERDPAASKTTKIHSAISQSMTLSIERGKPLWVNQDWIAKALPSYVANPSGTWTISDYDVWEFEDIDRCTLNFGSGAVSFHVESFQFTLSYDVTPIGPDGSGGYTVYGLKYNPPEWKLTVVKDADFHTALTNWSTNVPVDGRIGWGNATAGSVDADLDIVWHGKINDTVKAHDDIMKGEFSGYCLEAPGGTTAPFTIVMANDTDRTW